MSELFGNHMLVFPLGGSFVEYFLLTLLYSVAMLFNLEQFNSVLGNIKLILTFRSELQIKSYGL